MNEDILKLISITPPNYMNANILTSDVVLITRDCFQVKYY